MPPEIATLDVCPRARVKLFCARYTRPALVLPLTVIVRLPQPPEEAHTIIVAVPAVDPKRVSVLPDTFDCTTLGFEFEET